MSRIPLLFVLGVSLGGCTGPTLPIGPSPIPGTLVLDADVARNTYLFPFDPAALAVGGPGVVTVTGFIPFDLCGQSVSASYGRDGSNLFVTLTSALRAGAICPTWIAETHYSVTLTSLPPAVYQLFVVENPARRVVNGQATAKVDTLDLGTVTVAASP